MLNSESSQVGNSNSGLSFEERWLLKRLFLKVEAGPEEKPDSGPVDIFSSSSGDEGVASGQQFAAALWLVDHADLFLHAIKNAYNSDRLRISIDPTTEAEEIFQALSSELGSFGDDRLKLISQLMLKIGVSLQADAEDWETDSKNQFLTEAQKAALSISGTGCERYIFPWAFQIEESRSSLSLPERIVSLRHALPGKLSAARISELELNNWAYFLLLVGRWKAATPMAILATEMARYPRNLDTLGWAYYFEGNLDQSLEILAEALNGHDPIAESNSWAQVAYHMFYVLLQSGRTNYAKKFFDKMQKLLPDNNFWLSKCKDLRFLFHEQDQVVIEQDRSLRVFEYDIALSFAGEDRSYAELLAVELKKENVNVFYDDFKKAELWGKNLFTYLTDLYQNKARYCVMLVSKNYAAKRWTSLEREAAQARALAEDQEYILPVRIDTTQVPGVLPTIAYLDWEKEGVAGIVKCILKKMETH